MNAGERELADYLAVVWRGRWLILLGVLSCVAGAAIVTTLLPGLYRARTVVEVGALGEDRAREVERVVARVNGGGTPGAGGSVGRDRTVVAAEFRKPAIIELTADAATPEAAVGALRSTAGRLLEDLNDLRRFERQRHELLARQADGLRQLVERLRDARLQASSRLADPASALLMARLSDEIAYTEFRLIDLDERLASRGDRHGPSVLRESAAVRVRPRPALNLVIGALLGVFASIVGVFSLEYIREARARLRPDGGLRKA